MCVASVWIGCSSSTGKALAEYVDHFNRHRFIARWINTRLTGGCFLTRSLASEGFGGVIGSVD
ncbi:hypothetical protein [Amycolatopsis sp. lyj-90]|uniref:hypothetical protein n=1 Tax=Amycolatopsis sp. lyj-90 TaxID=2789285 RepID=UPI00397C0BB8